MSWTSSRKWRGDIPRHELSVLANRHLDMRAIRSHAAAIRELGIGEVNPSSVLGANHKGVRAVFLPVKVAMRLSGVVVLHQEFMGNGCASINWADYDRYLRYPPK